MVMGLLELMHPDYIPMSYTSETKPRTGGLERLPVPTYGQQLPIPPELRGGERRKMEKRLRLNRFLATLAEKTEKLERAKAEPRRLEEEGRVSKSVPYELPSHITSSWPLPVENPKSTSSDRPDIISLLCTRTEPTEEAKEGAAVLIQAVWRRHVRSLSQPQKPKVPVTDSSRRLSPKLRLKQPTTPREFNLTTSRRGKATELPGDQASVLEEAKTRQQDAVDIARAALQGLWELEGIEPPPRTPASAIVTRPNSSRLISTGWAGSHNSTGCTWSKSKLERVAQPRPASSAAPRTESIDLHKLRPEDEAPLIALVRKEEDPPLSAAMLAVLKRRIKQSCTLKHQLGALCPDAPSPAKASPRADNPSFARPTKSWRQRRAESETEAPVELSAPSQHMWPKGMPATPRRRSSTTAAVPTGRPEGESFRRRRAVARPPPPAYVVLDTRPESQPQALVTPRLVGSATGTTRGTFHSPREQNLAAMGRHQVSPLSATWGPAAAPKGPAQITHRTMPGDASGSVRSSNPKRWSNPSSGRSTSSFRVERSIRSWA